jgi:subtilase-type serine protease
MAYLNPAFSSISAGSPPALSIRSATRERLAKAISVGLDLIRQENKQKVRQPGFHWLTVCLTVSVLTVLTGFSKAAPAGSPLDYITLNYSGSGTFLTGIRGNNIVGNYVIAGTGETGGLLYNMLTATWTPFPEATANGANFPGAIGSSPYGPGFGSQFGILRTVGSYETQTSSPYDLSYLYDAATAGAKANLTTLVYPSTPSAPTLFTIAHSTFGNQIVGNYDTSLATGNAFLYTINTGAYQKINLPGISSTAYGIWGNMIAGG